MHKGSIFLRMDTAMADGRTHGLNSKNYALRIFRKISKSPDKHLQDVAFEIAKLAQKTDKGESLRRLVASKTKISAAIAKVNTVNATSTGNNISSTLNLLRTELEKDGFTYPHGMFSIFKAAELPAYDIICSFGANRDTVSALFFAGYTEQEIGDAITSRGLSAREVGELFLRIAKNSCASESSTAYHLLFYMRKAVAQVKEALSALKDMGFNAAQVGYAIHVYYGYTKEDILNKLNTVGFDTSNITKQIEIELKHPRLTNHAPFLKYAEKFGVSPTI